MGLPVVCLLPLFSFEKTVDAPRDVVFETFSGYADYPGMFPRHFPSVRVRSVRDATAVVEEHMNLGGKELVIMAKHVFQRPTLHEVYVIGGDAKGTIFRQRFLDTGHDCKTRVLVDVDLRLHGGMRISGIFQKKRYEYGLAEMIGDFAAAAEKS